VKNISFPRMVELDAVTGLPPRKVLDHDLPVLLRSAGSRGLPTCAIMIDIDHFKKFNDNYGHDIGDLVLRRVSGVIRKAVLFRGEAYRYGGEEITVLMLNSSSGEGLATARRLCSAVEKTAIETMVKGEPGSLSVTISLGVASTERLSGAELLVSADQALYRAKSSGRNQAVLFQEEDAKASTVTTLLDVHFPGVSTVQGGSFILLKKWFSHGNPTELEARELKDPGTDCSEFAEGPPPAHGYVEAEIRGRVSDIDRRGGHTYFKLEVKSEMIDLMIKYITDSINA
jgi:diguanylate cyclase (GGDEF)-like protein